MQFMKHITPQAQNHIFKDKTGRKPVPFQEENQDTTSFITLDELKTLERRRRNTMDSESGSDDDANDKRTETNDETNDDTLTTDGKETYDGETCNGEEDELLEEGDIDVDDTEDINDEKDEDVDDTEDINDEKDEEEKRKVSQCHNTLTVGNYLKRIHKKRRNVFTMNYEVIDEKW